MNEGNATKLELADEEDQNPETQNEQNEATEKEIKSAQVVENRVEEETVGDVNPSEVSTEELTPKQQNPAGRKGKKKQKWKKFDMDTVPDIQPGTNKPEPQKQAYNQSQSGSIGVWNNWSSAAPANNTQEQRNSYPVQQMTATSERRPVVNDVALSKALVRVLRHGKPHIPMDPKGYAFIDEILSHRDFKKFGVSVKDVIKLSDTNDKKRFEIEEESGRKKIRATQGHSLVLQDYGHTVITDPKKHDIVLHGTYKTNWRSIKKEGLARLKRTHIHFAIGHIGETHVTSGMRVTCDIIIYLDMEKAMNDGIKFYESANNVVLTEGDKNGFILPKYFKKVTRWSQDKYGKDVWTEVNLDQQS